MAQIPIQFNKRQDPNPQMNIRRTGKDSNMNRLS